MIVLFILSENTNEQKMTTNNNDDYCDYYLGTGRLLVLNQSVMDGLPNGCDFKKYLEKLDKNEMSIEETAYRITNTTFTKGYKMPDGWKHELIDNIVVETHIDDIEKYIGELGIRKAFKLYDDMGIGDEPPNPATDDGLMSLFYGVLDQIIKIGEGVEQIDKEQYDNQTWTWNQETQPEYDEDEDYEEEPEPEPEPEYGGLVAAAA